MRQGETLQLSDASTDGMLASSGAAAHHGQSEAACDGCAAGSDGWAEAEAIAGSPGRNHPRGVLTASAVAFVCRCRCVYTVQWHAPPPPKKNSFCCWGCGCGGHACAMAEAVSACLLRQCSACLLPCLGWARPPGMLGVISVPGVLRPFAWGRLLAHCFSERLVAAALMAFIAACLPWRVCVGEAHTRTCAFGLWHFC
jgi:hypothetical protein